MLTKNDLPEIKSLLLPLQKAIQDNTRLLDSHTKLLDSHTKLLSSLKKDQDVMLDLLDVEQMNQRKKFSVSKND
jgi:hypothetical protein